MGFDGRMVIPRRMIKLPMQVGNEVVEVNFIVVEAYSPYTTILARPWLHAIGAVSSTLHIKVKFPTEGRIGELMGSQTMARQCLVAAIRHQLIEKGFSGFKGDFVEINGARRRTRDRVKGFALWGIREGDARFGWRQVFLGGNSTIPCWKGRTLKFLEEEYKCFCVECIWGTQSWPRFYMPPSECKSYGYTEKATTSALFKGTRRGSKGRGE